jgi:hypothetical protein
MENPFPRRYAATLIVLAAFALFPAGCSTQQKPRTKAHTARTTHRPEPLPPVVSEFGSQSQARWRPFFQAAGVAYPPAEVLLAAFKRERRIDVYAGPSASDLSLVRRIAITAASGRPGPKLREGDHQVPEGFYDIDVLNPNSLYHVAMHLDYPNEFDERMAKRDHRRNLGDKIMIHGDAVSIGCIAVGDEGAEDLFTLAAHCGLSHLSVLIAPRDFRRTGEYEALPGQPSWVRSLYADLEQRLLTLPVESPVHLGTAGRTLHARRR